MSKKKGKAPAHYDDQLRTVQIAMSNLQRRIIKDGRKLLVIIQGRDAGRKEGTINRSRVTARKRSSPSSRLPSIRVEGVFRR